MRKLAILLVIVCFNLALLNQAEITIAQEKEKAKTDFPAFQAHLIDSFPGGYKVAVADLNNDSRLDIIGLSTTPAHLVWYENPSWEKHVITTKTKENIDLAACDIDGDGRIDLALASEFNMRRTTAGGLLHWLRCPDDPTREWTIRYIGEEPTSHRLVWADIDGDSRKELLNAPIMGRGAQEPEWNVGVNLVWFEIPDNPEQSPWEPRLIDNQLTVLHGVSVVDWDGDECDDILTASFEGVHLFRSKVQGNVVSWEKSHLGEGFQTDAPERGSSEIALGHLNSSKQRFLATIEPWHGNNVVVYIPGAKMNEKWERHVIDESFNQGHALVCADIDGDGDDEIIAGYRGKGTSLYIYRCMDLKGTSWMRIPLDEGDMATSGICTGDINGDGLLDIVAVGTATANIKWYENSGSTISDDGK